MRHKDGRHYPGETIGILGGGQLGRMIALEARRMGYRVKTLDPTPDSPCGQVSDEQVVAPFDDVEAAKAFAQTCDVVTYEFENVDAQVATVLEQTSHVPQGSQLLRTTQHRIREKEAILRCGVPVAPFAPVDSLPSLVAKASIIGYPCVLKTTQGGYDGKGQWLIEHPRDVETVWAGVVTRLAQGVVSDDKPALSPLILETYISFQMELSVVVARTADGQTKCFPVSENVHDHHVLHLSIVPARVTEEVANTARSIASRIAESLDLIGVLAVELFLTEDGQLYVNELAPRPHNSGHYTGDACVTSQFEQHVRAVCNLPLGDTKLLSPVVMVNILGKHLDAVMRQLPHLPANMKLHLYGKQGAAPRRKMGHINVLADTTEEALGQIESMAIW